MIDIYLVDTSYIRCAVGCRTSHNLWNVLHVYRESTSTGHLLVNGFYCECVGYEGHKHHIHNPIQLIQVIKIMERTISHGYDTCALAYQAIDEALQSIDGGASFKPWHFRQLPI